MYPLNAVYLLAKQCLFGSGIETDATEFLSFTNSSIETITNDKTRVDEETGNEEIITSDKTRADEETGIEEIKTDKTTVVDETANAEIKDEMNVVATTDVDMTTADAVMADKAVDDSTVINETANDSTTDEMNVVAMTVVDITTDDAALIDEAVNEIFSFLHQVVYFLLSTPEINVVGEDLRRLFKFHKIFNLEYEIVRYYNTDEDLYENFDDKIYSKIAEEKTNNKKESSFLKWNSLQDTLINFDVSSLKNIIRNLRNTKNPKYQYEDLYNLTTKKLITMVTDEMNVQFSREIKFAGMHFANDLICYTRQFITDILNRYIDSKESEVAKEAIIPAKSKKYSSGFSDSSDDESGPNFPELEKSQKLV